MKNILALSVALCLAEPSYAQHTNIKISSAYNPNEPSIAINTKNPAELVAGANIDNVYVSTDTGKTWTTSLLTSRYGVWSDPVIVNDTSGKFYFFHLSNPTFPSSLPWLDRMVCQRLDAINGSWSKGSYATSDTLKDHDKEWVAVDRNTNTMYMTWTVFDKYRGTDPDDSSNILFAKSVDNGDTWSSPVRINDIAGNCLDDDSTVEGAVPAVGPNGEVYITWMNAYGLFFDKSTDGGNTWLPKDTFIDSVPGGWNYIIPGLNRANGFPFIDCDVSGGTYNGNIYINWSDQRNGVGNTDIWFASSTDGGNTWSKTKRVNDDVNIDRHQFLNSMTVDQITGYIYILFYDRRNYADDRTDVYMAVSQDGGNTFINQKISDMPFIPFNNTFFGDYTDITAHNSIIRPIWCRQDTGRNSIWIALIDTSLLFPGNPGSVFLEQDIVYPNPFTSTTFMAFKLRTEKQVSLEVVDMYGRTVESLLDKEMLQRGKHVFRFNADNKNLPDGMYCFILKYDDVVLSRKIILSR